MQVGYFPSNPNVYKFIMYVSSVPVCVVEFILAQSARLNERRGEGKLRAKDTRTKGNNTT